jgi:2-amino-4-hydroxy-6-hydroxymethyldihydropteridine diphosphokinase
VARAFVGLGANLGDREGAIRSALELLAARDGVEVVAVSTLRDTAPVGRVDQPRFLNGAAELETTLPPRDLLEALFDVERELGRERRERWGPRAIDLDLLLYGAEQVDEPELTVPHPRLHVRGFVLEPLAELDAELDVPGRGRVTDLLARLD